MGAQLATHLQHRPSLPVDRADPIDTAAAAQRAHPPNAEPLDSPLSVKQPRSSLPVTQLQRANVLVDSLAARQRLINHLQAQQSTDLAQLAGNYPGLREFLSMEVAAALGVSEHIVDSQLETAEYVAQRLPATRLAWERGELDAAKVRYLVEHTQHLSVDELAAVEERVLPRADGQRMPAFRAAVRRAVLSVNPESAEEQHQQAVEKRHVSVESCAHGMALLTYYAPAQDVALVWEVLTGTAEAARTPGDARTLAQRRADALAGLCSGVLDFGLPDGSRLSKRRCQRARLVVTMPVSVLTGSTDICELGRYGPITALQALQIAEADANLQRLVCDPASGALVDASPVDHYRPPGWLAEQIEARDQTCMAPGCYQPASRTEIDHCVPFGKGGKTEAANLGLLCKHHHRSKDGGGWFLERLPDGTFRWTSPLGRIHDRTSTRWWHEPEPGAGAAQFLNAEPGVRTTQFVDAEPGWIHGDARSGIGDECGSPASRGAPPDTGSPAAATEPTATQSDQPPTPPASDAATTDRATPTTATGPTAEPATEPGPITGSGPHDDPGDPDQPPF